MVRGARSTHGRISVEGTMDGFVDLSSVRVEEPEAPDGASALALLQSVYRDTAQPLHTRIRCAVEALPYENPKLSAMAVTSLNGNDFARALDRAIMRSGKLIEAKAIEPPQPE
jgi:hypothetical protein